MSDANFRDDRREYVVGELLEENAPAQPDILFKAWFDNWSKLNRPDTTAMTLSTVGEDGKPDARIVLLKGYANNRFEFFTNYNSKKGTDLAQNNQAHLLFFWPEVEQQVRVRGKAVKMSPEENAAYFASRPLASQLGAISSRQSHPVESRGELERELEANMTKYKDENPPCPPYWGGFVIEAEEIEFWQGRASRLHDRLRYERTPEGWGIVRLAP